MSDKLFGLEYGDIEVHERGDNTFEATTRTVIEGAVVGHPNIPGPRFLRNPSYLDIRIREDSNDRYA